MLSGVHGSNERSYHHIDRVRFCSNVVRGHSNNTWHFLGFLGPLPHVSLGDTTHRLTRRNLFNCPNCKFFWAINNSNVRNYCSIKGKMSSDTLVDPFPPHVLSGDIFATSPLSVTYYLNGPSNLKTEFHFSFYLRNISFPTDLPKSENRRSKPRLSRWEESTRMCSMTQSLILLLRSDSLLYWTTKILYAK